MSPPSTKWSKESQSSNAGLNAYEENKEQAVSESYDCSLADLSNDTKKEEETKTTSRTYKKRVPVLKNNKTFNFSVGKGNYPNHIINGFLARGNWKQIDEDNAIE